MNGTLNCLDLLRLVLRWLIGRSVFSGDLSQYYNSFRLDKRQWNLQRFVWKENLDPLAETKEGVITTFIYGVKSVSAQTEETVRQLAETVKSSMPLLSTFLLNCLYVDDMGESKSSLEECQNLT